LTDAGKRKKTNVDIGDKEPQESNAQIAEGDAELNVEDDFDELAENFEASYNFRFEEP
jgi:hypothetical protein